MRPCSGCRFFLCAMIPFQNTRENGHEFVWYAERWVAPWALGAGADAAVSVGRMRHRITLNALVSAAFTRRSTPFPYFRVALRPYRGYMMPRVLRDVQRFVLFPKIAVAGP